MDFGVLGTARRNFWREHLLHHGGRLGSPLMHVGCAVRVVGLASKRASAYNSRIGKIIALDDGERATLLLDDGETLPLRSRNLEALSAEESAAFAAREAKTAKLVAEKKAAEAQVRRVSLKGILCARKGGRGVLTKLVVGLNPLRFDLEEIQWQSIGGI